MGNEVFLMTDQDELRLTPKEASGIPLWLFIVSGIILACSCVFAGMLGM